MERAISIIIKPTDTCNIRCLHCYHASVGYEKNILPINIVHKMIDIATDKYKYVNIMFHGGEPTCVPLHYYENIIDYSKSPKFHDTHFKWLIQTNATLITEAWVNFFKINHVSVGVSFDGPCNSSLRQKTEDAYAGIKLLQKNKVHVSSIATVSSETIDRMIPIYEFFKKEQLDFKFGYVFRSGAAKTKEYLCVDVNKKIESLVNLYKYWAFDKSCNIMCGDMIQLSYLLLKIPINLCVYQSCLSQWISLSPDGNIFPCGRNWDKNYVLGNIYDIHSFDELWDSNAFHKLLIESISRRESCKKCNLFCICKGGCNNDSFLNGDVAKRDSNHCKFLQGCVNALTIFISKIRDDSINWEKYNPQLIKILRQYDDDHTIK